MEPRHPPISLRIDLGRKARLGPGKIALMEQIAATGSISAAGRALGMSYRRAWVLIDALNRMFDDPLVATAAGGAQGGGAVLTPFGAELVAAYRGLEDETRAAAAARLHPVLATRRLREAEAAPGVERTG